MIVITATQSEVVVVDADRETVTVARGPTGRPTCLSADPRVPGRAWCGTHRSGVFRSDDGGASWQACGLPGRLIMSIAASPTEPDVVWAGTEPSEVWRSDDAGATWQQSPGLDGLPSSSEWSFPPRPDTHHVRWLACHPTRPGLLWAAIEAGALVSTRDGGRTWHDRVAGGPWDTHELAIHAAAPDTLRVAAGDGYFESHDAGASWQRPRDGLDVGYLRSVVIDTARPDVVAVSAASGPRSTYTAGRSDGRLYRRTGAEAWQRVTDGWPADTDTIAPLLTAHPRDDRLWAADERGVHCSDNAGLSWRRVTTFPTSPDHLRGIAAVR
jgi:photosystem II stability/assembly factor-like uncharacterized protein